MALDVDARSKTLLLDDLVEARKTESASIEYVKEPITYWEFFSRFLIPNKPCVFSPKSTADWLCRKEWVATDGKPDFDFLQNAFGHATVPVANCDEEKFCSHVKSDMLFKDYIDYWTNYIEKGYPKSLPTKYCKDWHLARAFPGYKFYSTAPYFESDWLNEFWDTMKDGADDYRFVYMGTKGTWTPFHSDVLKSYSWSANICGRKKWIFFPPGEEKCLMDRFGQLAYDVTSLDDLKADPVQFPHVSNLKHRFEIFQEAGEMVFVPSGWHHQVFNLEDTISINHNWMNGCNIDMCWDHVKSNLEKVKNEIDDCRAMMDLDDEEGSEFSEKCQVILKAASGIDYTEFFNFMFCIADHRMKNLREIAGEHLECQGNNCEFGQRYDCAMDEYFDGCSSRSDSLDNELEAVDILEQLEQEEREDSNLVSVIGGKIKEENNSVSWIGGEKEVNDSTSIVSGKASDCDVGLTDTVVENSQGISDADKNIAPQENINAAEEVAGGTTVKAGESISVKAFEESNCHVVCDASIPLEIDEVVFVNDSAVSTNIQSDKSGALLPINTDSVDSSETCDYSGSLGGRVGQMECQATSKSFRSRSICQTFGLSQKPSEDVFNHFVFDLNRTVDILEDMLRNEDFQGMDDSNLVADPEEFLNDVKHFLRHVQAV